MQIVRYSILHYRFAILNHTNIVSSFVLCMPEVNQCIIQWTRFEIVEQNAKPNNTIAPTRSLIPSSKIVHMSTASGNSLICERLFERICINLKL